MILLANPDAADLWGSSSLHIAAEKFRVERAMRSPHGCCLTVWVYEF